MKKLRLSFDKAALNLPKAEEDKSAIELTSIIIRNIIISWATSGQKRGLVFDDRRKYDKICDVLEKAIKENIEEVELDDDWMGFIRKCFREAELIPNELLRKVEGLIEEVKDR